MLVHSFVSPSCASYHCNVLFSEKREICLFTYPHAQPLSRPQQSLDLAPGNFPPLPTSEAGGTSPPSTTPTQALDSTEAKNTSNLADIVKGKKQKESALPITIANHPPLPSSTTGITLSQSHGAAFPSDEPPPQLVVQPTTNLVSTTTCTCTTTLTSAQSITTSSTPILTQSPSIAAVVASNIPPTIRTTPVHSIVSTAVSSSSMSVTTAAAVVAGGAQTTIVTTSTVNSSSGPSNGRPYSYKANRGESKVSCLEVKLNCIACYACTRVI